MSNLPSDSFPDKPKREDFPTLEAYEEALQQWEDRDLFWFARQLPPDDPQHQAITNFFKKSSKADRKFEAKSIGERQSGRPHNPRWAMERVVDQFSIYCETVLATVQHDIQSARELETEVTRAKDDFLNRFMEWCRDAVPEELDRVARELYPELNLQLLELLSQTKDRAWDSIPSRPEAHIPKTGPPARSADAIQISETPESSSQPVDLIAASEKAAAKSTRNLALLTNPQTGALLETVPVELAAKYAGVTPRTIREHMRGRTPDIKHRGGRRNRRLKVDSLIDFYPA